MRSTRFNESPEGQEIKLAQVATLFLIIAVEMLCLSIQLSNIP